MTKAEQQRHVEIVLDGIRAEIMSKLDKIPENWKGQELNCYIAEKAHQWSSQMDKKRKAAYDNDIVVNNL